MRVSWPVTTAALCIATAARAEGAGPRVVHEVGVALAVLRAGVSHMSTEYTTVRALDAGNDRFRTSATRFFVGVNHRF